MRLDSLFPFIVPLTFLAIWALTSLLNRDAQPLPPRPVRGGPGGAAQPPRAMNRPTPAQGPVTREWGGPPPRPRPSPNPRERAAPLSGLSRDPSGDEGIVLLSDANEPRRGGRGETAPQARTARSGKPVRVVKGRPTPGPRPAAQQDESPRALSDLVNQSMADTKARPLEIEPLAAPLTPLMIPLSRASSTLAAEKGVERPKGVPLELIRSALAAPDRLREIALLTEIFKPPLALRSTRRER